VAADAQARACEKKSETPVANDRAGTVGRSVAPGTADALRLRWRKAERSRETDWENASAWLPSRLRRRAFLVARLLPVLPGRTVLELGAGSGLWTEQLSSVFSGQNPLTAAVFNEDLERKARARNLPHTRVVAIDDIQSAFSPESYDYVVATEIAGDKVFRAALEVAFLYLKPGGQFLFLPRNQENPLAFVSKVSNLLSRKKPGGGLQQDFTLRSWTDAAFELGFEGVESALSEVIPPLRNGAGQAVGLILERAPLVRRFSKIISLRGARPGSATNDDAPPVSLAVHRKLFDTVSVVVPCHNEEANISRLVKTLLGMYGPYLHEIVIVDDNSTDRTAEVAAAVAGSEARVKLVRRKPPAGVGRALREGYAAAGGKYILSIDCDFINIAAEFQGLFDAMAEGCDGAIGSRFSSESALVRYPFFKILCNRGYHLLLNLLLGKRVRDISNNLKLYRAEILKNLDIEEDHFAANVETGLKPLLQNYRIREVPTSWINRTEDMGTSSFNLLKVGPDYLGVLLRTTWRYWRGQFRVSG
jgi:dolichol-phosphate mannosyltransferase